MKRQTPLVRVTVCLLCLAAWGPCKSAPPAEMQIVIPTKGLSALDAEQLVTQPVETKLASLPALTSLTTWSTDKSIWIRARFASGTDLATIQAQIPALLRDHPYQPVLHHATAPLAFSFSCHACSVAQLNATFQNSVESRLQGLAPLTKRCGERQPEITVSLTSDRLFAYDLSLAQVLAALRDTRAKSGQSLAPTGPASVEALRRWPLPTKGPPLRLTDVAVIEEQLGKPDCRFWTDEGTAIYGELLARDKEHRQTLAQAFQRLAAGIPPGYALRRLEEPDGQTYGVRLAPAEDSADRLVRYLQRTGLRFYLRISSNAPWQDGHLWIEGQGVRPDPILPGVVLVPRKTPLFAATFLACGPTRDGLHQVGQRLKQWVEKQPGVLTTELLGARMATDLQIRVERDRAARLGIAASVITERMAAALEGIEVPPTGRPRIRVHMDPIPKATPQAITDLSVPTATGERVSIAHIVSLEAVASPVALLRHNQRPCMAARGWFHDPPKASVLITSLAEHVPLPPGFTVEWSPDWD